MKRIVVTHFSGPLGHSLSRHYSGRDIVIDGVDSFWSRGFQQAPFGSANCQSWVDRQSPGFMHYEFDLAHRDAVMDLIREIRPSAIIHSPRPDATSDDGASLAGTRNLLEAAREFCWLSPFLFYSPSPANETALLVQDYRRQFELPTTCLHGPWPTDPWNPDGALYDPLASAVQACLHDQVYVTSQSDLSRVREAIHAEDAANLIALFLEQPQAGDVYRLGAGEKNTYRLREVLPLIEQKVGRPLRIQRQAEVESQDTAEFSSDFRPARDHVPSWHPRYAVDQILDELIEVSSATPA